MRLPRRIPLLVVLLVAPASARAQDPVPSQPPSGSKVGLERLLRLPDQLDYETDERAGATRSEWRARFEEARGSLSSAEAALEAAQDELAEQVGKKDAWSVAPPGLPAESTDGGTDSFRLREEVRRQRAEVARAKHRLRELEIQANLAGVPDAWRGPSTGASPGNESVPRSEAQP